MIIKASATLRQNYNDIVSLCKETKEPVFLTKNGDGDAVIMDMETFNRREKILELRENLLKIEENRMRGQKGYSPEEVYDILGKVIEEAAGEQKEI